MFVKAPSGWSSERQVSVSRVTETSREASRLSQVQTAARSVPTWLSPLPPTPPPARTQEQLLPQPPASCPRYQLYQ